MLYFNANAGDFLNILEHPLPTNLPPQPQTSPQMLSDPEYEDPFIYTSPQQNSGEFVCTYVCECVCMCASLQSILQTVLMLLSLGMCDVLHYKRCE